MFSGILTVHTNSHATSNLDVRMDMADQAIAMALLIFNDLRCSVTPIFLLTDHYRLQV